MINYYRNLSSLNLVTLAINQPQNESKCQRRKKTKPKATTNVQLIVKSSLMS